MHATADKLVRANDEEMHLIRGTGKGDATERRAAVDRRVAVVQLERTLHHKVMNKSCRSHLILAETQ